MTKEIQGDGSKELATGSSESPRPAQLRASRSDLEKILDTLVAAKRFFLRRDEMNAEVHLAREVRYSPLTTECAAQCDRLRTMLEGNDES